MLSGAIMVFTRSVSETGATVAVASNLQTTPVLLVNWIRQVVPASNLDIALGAGFLVLLSFIVLLVLRLVVGREEKY
jgi:ABC-type sulfate transport system permease component